MLVLLSIVAAIVLVVSTLVGQLAFKYEAEVKTLNTLILFGFAFFFAVTNFHWLFVVICVGLAFSAAGDYMLAKRKHLDNTGTIYFVAGLGSFLIGYLVYGVAFIIFGGFTFGTVIALILFIPLGIAQYLSMDVNKLTGMEMPIIAYLFQATTLAAAAGTLVSLFSVPALLIAVGCTSLYISDSLIGHNLFRKPLKNPELSIMPTYVVGQSLILIGAYLLLV